MASSIESFTSNIGYVSSKVFVIQEYGEGISKATYHRYVSVFYNNKSFVLN